MQASTKSKPEKMMIKNMAIMMYSTIVTILSVHLFIYKVRMSSYVYYNTFYITIYIIISIGAESGIPAIGVFVHVLENFGVFLFA